LNCHHAVRIKAISVNNSFIFIQTKYSRTGISYKSSFAIIYVRIFQPIYYIMYYELHIHVPGWGFGVTDPTSTKPNPMLSKGPTTSPFLSTPAARPIGLENGNPSSVVASTSSSVSMSYIYTLRHLAHT
jgi:hypothetical protein